LNMQYPSKMIEYAISFKDDWICNMQSSSKRWSNFEPQDISQWMKHVLFLLSYMVENLESAYAISWHASWILF
jgi:hypothetical protein